MLKTALAIRHVHFEDLGRFNAVLTAAGYRIDYLDVDVDRFARMDPVLPDLLVMLGGPVGVNDGDAYPFLAEERRILTKRLAAGRPTLGICLGAQQIAATLGARVQPMGHREIGFAAVGLSPAGAAGPLRHLGGVPVLHWHGDTFDTPPGAENLASTPLCATQGFALGQNVLGLQFHPETDLCAGIEPWLIGHAAELAAAGIDPAMLRTEAARIGPDLRHAARRMLAEWLEGLAA
ncbi:glutamine amidotransferase [Paracoccus pacificus]|uniref:Glutamine amidotransferase n=1 Tax=Paracoccus pacificus TaxID=1463598 RepID=A0ABW4R1L9_9RHOB